MKLAEQIYQAAANASLTTACRWLPADGSPSRAGQVGFFAADESVLDGLAVSTDYAITYPASAFQALAAGDAVEIDQVRYQVREVRALGDGSEMRASLARS